jgi:hypothetical protein
MIVDRAAFVQQEQSAGLETVLKAMITIFTGAFHGTCSKRL